VRVLLNNRVVLLRDSLRDGLEGTPSLLVLGLLHALPTRSKDYEPGGLDAPESSFLTLPASKVGELRNSFRRSESDCYPEVTKILYFHLKRIVEFRSLVSTK